MLRGNPYLFAVMDNSSRFILSHMASPIKFGVKPLDMFRWQYAEVVPRVFITDGLHNFCKPIKKAFWCRAGRRLVYYTRYISEMNLITIMYKKASSGP